MKKEAMRALESLTLATAWLIAAMAGPIAASCDPNIGPIGGAFEAVIFSPMVILYNHMIAGGILALAATLLFITPWLQDRFRHPPAWWVTVAIVSIPVVFGLSLLISYACGIFPVATRCAV